MALEERFNRRICCDYIILEKIMIHLSMLSLETQLEAEEEGCIITKENATGDFQGKKDNFAKRV